MIQVTKDKVSVMAEMHDVDLALLYGLVVWWIS